MAIEEISRRTFVGAAAGAAAIAGIGGMASGALADEPSRGTWTNGEYVGVGAGFMGAEIQAHVTLDDTGIVAITFDDACGQTAGIGTYALEKMPSRIIEAQSVGVDVITCATKTSRGVLDAVSDALAQAGADLETWSTPVEAEDLSAEPAISMEADVVVLGAGGAGMVAALAAIERGESVIVVEKSDIAGGNTARSEGHTLIGMSEYQKSLGIEDDFETMSNDVQYISRWLSRQNLMDLMLENCGPTFDWIVSQTDMPLSGNLITENGPGQSGILRSYEPTVGRGGEFTPSFEQAILASDLATVFYGVAGQSLIEQDSVVCGLVAADVRTGQTYEFSAPKVVLATGCFPGTDQQLREQYGVKELYRSSASPVISGDGHRMALGLGAGTWRPGQETVRVSNAFEYAAGRGVGLGSVMKMLNSGAGIVVNQEGKRFAAEYDGTQNNALMPSLVHGFSNGCVYAVMDEATFMGSLYVEPSATTNETSNWDAWIEQNNCEAGGIAHGATVEEAATNADIDAEALVSTIKYYNYRLEVGAGDEYARPDAQPVDLEFGEIYIIRLTQSYVCTSGGLWVTDDMQVCDEAHEPIAGLYAAGNVAGGGMGEPYYMGGSLAWSFVSGKIAGEAQS